VKGIGLIYYFPSSSDCSTREKSSFLPGISQVSDLKDLECKNKDLECKNVDKLGYAIGMVYITDWYFGYFENEPGDKLRDDEVGMIYSSIVNDALNKFGLLSRPFSDRQPRHK
jgi:hypothetical protein